MQEQRRRRSSPGRHALRDRERGSMTAEMVLVTPLLVMFLLLVVAGGRFVAVRGEVEAATRDAARAASLERDTTAALTSAEQTVSQSLGDRWNCLALDLDSLDWRPGGTVTVRLTCEVSYRGLGLIGLPGSITITRDSTAPLDLYRRTGS